MNVDSKLLLISDEESVPEKTLTRKSELTDPNDNLSLLIDLLAEAMVEKDQRGGVSGCE
jgi:hypothetical protein